MASVVKVFTRQYMAKNSVSYLRNITLKFTQINFHEEEGNIPFTRNLFESVFHDTYVIINIIYLIFRLYDDIIKTRRFVCKQNK